MDARTRFRSSEEVSQVFWACWYASPAEPSQPASVEVTLSRSWSFRSSLVYDEPEIVLAAASISPKVALIVTLISLYLP
jgi:hypothetical protein